MRDARPSRLEAAFRLAAERMGTLPIVNAALEVEAVAFAPWEDRWLGVMVTPWFINLVLAPLDPAQWRSLGQGEKLRYRFPAGDYEFIGAIEPGAGEFQPEPSRGLKLGEPRPSRRAACP